MTTATNAAALSRAVRFAQRVARDERVLHRYTVAQWDRMRSRALALIPAAQGWEVDALRKLVSTLEELVQLEVSERHGR